jgi:hypothetical protein
MLRSKVKKESIKMVKRRIKGIKKSKKKATPE